MCRLSCGKSGSQCLHQVDERVALEVCSRLQWEWVYLVSTVVALVSKMHPIDTELTGSWWWNLGLSEFGYHCSAWTVRRRTLWPFHGIDIASVKAACRSRYRDTNCWHYPLLNVANRSIQGNPHHLKTCFKSWWTSPWSLPDVTYCPPECHGAVCVQESILSSSGCKTWVTWWCVGLTWTTWSRAFLLDIWY